MSENDYIAEYVKEKYPNILGVEFALWKTIRIVSDAVASFADLLRDFSKEDIEKAIKEGIEHGEEE